VSGLDAFAWIILMILATSVIAVFGIENGCRQQGMPQDIT
jgi:hypothetical protein